MANYSSALVAAPEFPQTLEDLDPARVMAVLLSADRTGAAAPIAKALLVKAFQRRQSRAGEADRSMSQGEEARALYTDPMFWTLCMLLPHNTLATLRPKFGRPRDYPDWLLLLIALSANLAGLGSRGAATRYFRDRRVWVDFVHDVDRYVPEGWAQLRQLDHEAGKHARSSRRRVPAPKFAATNVVTIKPLRETSRQRSEALTVVPPKEHHLDYFMQLWKGMKKSSTGEWVSLDPHHPWYGVREQAMPLFRELAAERAQQMGLLLDTQRFEYKTPDRAQAVGMDGTVFPIPRYKQPNKAKGIEKHIVAGRREEIGSKWTLASTRIPNQPSSRLILDFGHTGHAKESAWASEGQAMVAMAKALYERTHGGARLLLADSAMRGKDVVDLQTSGITVVNYPHAASNPNGGAGKRLAADRVEKSHLRTTAMHTDANGQPCYHPIYASGGSLLERFIDADGEANVRTVEVLAYEQREGRNGGSRREYKIIRIDCALAGPFEHRVPLFHTSPTSSDPDYNWGEVVRVFEPGSEQFAYLYGARNDTEARHNNLKGRIKYMPGDILGQEFRLLGAALVMNAATWQMYLHSLNLPNVIDDTV